MDHAFDIDLAKTLVNAVPFVNNENCGMIARGIQCGTGKTLARAVSADGVALTEWFTADIDTIDLASCMLKERFYAANGW